MMARSRRCGAALIGVALALATPAASAAPVVREVERLDDAGAVVGTYRYTLVLPEGYDPEKTYPVLIALPPGPQNADMVTAGLERYWRAEAEARGWVVASPEAPGAMLWKEGDVIFPALLDDVAKQVKVEGGSGGFFVAGVSNGGRSAFHVAVKHPERFRGLLAIPGFADGDDHEGLLKIKGIPVRMYVGEKDASWRDSGKRTADRLRGMKADVTLTVVPGDEHVVTSVSPAALFDVLEAMRQIAKPETPADG